MKEHIQTLTNCVKCSIMSGPPIHGCVFHKADIMSVGQAPGIHESKFMKPFSYTAGKTLFRWLAKIGIKENDFRKKVQMSAVCRCFPGKLKGGDRKPSKEEVMNCEPFLKFEIQYHQPGLIIPIGRLAIDQLLPSQKYKLNDVIGRVYRLTKYGIHFDCICLPHPSGLNTWNHTNQGKELIAVSLQRIKDHPSVLKNFGDSLA